MNKPTEEKCAQCGEYSIKQTISLTNIGDPYRLGIKKHSPEWKEFISKMKKAHPKGNVNEHW